MTQINTLRNLSVSQAMRRQITCLDQSASISYGITTVIKYKVNALLTVDAAQQPVGVVSKTDIMGAYYAGLPIDSPLEHIMMSPPLFCKAGDSLEAALEQMRTNRVYRLYVTDDRTGELAGALAYPDIVGLLYQYCRQCDYSNFNRRSQSPKNDAVEWFKVRELMNVGINSLPMHATLNAVMEALAAYRFGAMLITDENDHPHGVISKTDLALAYKRGVSQDEAVEKIMSVPVQTCDADLLLEEAIKKMIVEDIHRLFVHEESTNTLVGVLSLSDAARGRSGSCHACVSSRIKIEDDN